MTQVGTSEAPRRIPRWKLHLLGVVMVGVGLFVCFVPVTTCKWCEKHRIETWNGPQPVTGVRWIDHVAAWIPGCHAYTHIEGEENCPYCRGTGDVSLISALRIP